MIYLTGDCDDGYMDSLVVCAFVLQIIKYILQLYPLTYLQLFVFMCLQLNKELKSKVQFPKINSKPQNYPFFEPRTSIKWENFDQSQNYN